MLYLKIPPQMAFYVFYFIPLTMASFEKSGS